jgi:hypothetical protein
MNQHPHLNIPKPAEPSQQSLREQQLIEIEQDIKGLLITLASKFDVLNEVLKLKKETLNEEKSVLQRIKRELDALNI